ncbi:hypothetical protein MTO96_013374 [Rhipicephalus appendiculatus]
MTAKVRWSRRRIVRGNVPGGPWAQCTVRSVQGRRVVAISSVARAARILLRPSSGGVDSPARCWRGDWCLDRYYGCEEDPVYLLPNLLPLQGHRQSGAESGHRARKPDFPVIRVTRQISCARTHPTDSSQTGRFRSCCRPGWGGGHHRKANNESPSLALPYPVFKKQCESLIATMSHWTARAGYLS